MGASIRVAILGQNSIVREGLRRILADEDFDVRQSVAEASRLSEDGVGDDLLILIDGDPELGGTNAVRALRERFPAVKMVVLSDQFDFDAMADAFAAGVSGYIVKEISCAPLIGSLRLVAMGEKVMPSRLADELPRHGESDERLDARLMLENAQLSARENDILRCLVIGCSNKVISRRLAITEATVKVHVKAILRKLRVTNRTQAAIRAINGGLDPNAVEPLPLFSVGVAADARRDPVSRVDTLN